MEKTKSSGYGVFLSVSPDDGIDFTGYTTVVIDADNFTKEQISEIKAGGTRVFSYLNVGSVESFRSYYNDFVGITLGVYVNWEEERWVDVSQSAWQEHIAVLANEFAGKGVDGFYIDNCDVYCEYNTTDIFDGLAVILKSVKKTGLECMMNCGDEFYEMCERRGLDIRDYIDSVNQEEVFSLIDFGKGRLIKQKTDDHRHFKSYIEKAAKAGLKIYLLEYTTDEGLCVRIGNYCKKMNFEYYISDSVELDG